MKQLAIAAAFVGAIASADAAACGGCNPPAQNGTNVDVSNSVNVDNSNKVNTNVTNTANGGSVTVAPGAVSGGVVSNAINFEQRKQPVHSAIAPAILGGGGYTAADPNNPYASCYTASAGSLALSTFGLGVGGGYAPAKTLNTQCKDDVDAFMRRENLNANGGDAGKAAIISNDIQRDPNLQAGVAAIVPFKDCSDKVSSAIFGECVNKALPVSENVKNYNAVAAGVPVAPLAAPVLAACPAGKVRDPITLECKGM